MALLETKWDDSDLPFSCRLDGLVFLMGMLCRMPTGLGCEVSLIVSFSVCCGF